MKILYDASNKLICYQENLIVAKKKNFKKEKKEKKKKKKGFVISNQNY